MKISRIIVFTVLAVALLTGVMVYKIFFDRVLFSGTVDSIPLVAPDDAPVILVDGRVVQISHGYGSDPTTYSIGRVEPNAIKVGARVKVRAKVLEGSYNGPRKYTMFGCSDCYIKLEESR